jgi:hypothetical protein
MVWSCFARPANPQAVRRFLEPLVKDLGVSVIVTDDLASFRRVAEKLEGEQQVYQFRVRHWVGPAAPSPLRISSRNPLLRPITGTRCR